MFHAGRYVRSIKFSSTEETIIQPSQEIIKVNRKFGNMKRLSLSLTNRLLEEKKYCYKYGNLSSLKVRNPVGTLIVETDR